MPSVVPGIVGCSGPADVPGIQAPVLTAHKVRCHVPVVSRRPIGPPADEGCNGDGPGVTGPSITEQGLVPLPQCGRIVVPLADKVGNVSEPGSPPGIRHLCECTGSPGVLCLLRLEVDGLVRLATTAPCPAEHAGVSAAGQPEALVAPGLPALDPMLVCRLDRAEQQIDQLSDEIRPGLVLCRAICELVIAVLNVEMPKRTGKPTCDCTHRSSVRPCTKFIF